jgi:hypothetical protein
MGDQGDTMLPAHASWVHELAVPDVVCDVVQAVAVKEPADESYILLPIPGLPHEH